MAGIFPLRRCTLCGKMMRASESVCGSCVDALGTPDPEPGVAPADIVPYPGTTIEEHQTFIEMMREAGL